MSAQPKVLVLNGNEHVLETLATALEEYGYAVRTALLHDLERQRPPAEDILREFQPHAVLYDISLPYERSFGFYQHVRALAEARNISFVLTTTNARALEQIMGVSLNALELLLKPYDLQRLQQRLASELTRLGLPAPGGAATSGETS